MSRGPEDGNRVTASHATPRVFPGWNIVGLSLLTQALQAGILIYAFGTMAISIEQEFGASRAQVMLAATVLSLASNFLSPFAGNLVDRRSVRSLMLVAITALAAGLVCLAFTQALWQVWLVFGTLLPVGNLLLGQLPTSALISRWFSRLRGRAMGVAAVDTSLGGFVFPVLLAFLIQRYDWRTALAIIGIAAFVVTAPLIRSLVVDRPADRGLYPDHAAGPPPGDAVASASAVGIASVLRDPAFWCQTVAIGIALFVYTGFLSNLYPHAISLAVTPGRAASMMSLVAVCSVIGKLSFGTVADRLDLRLTMGSSFGLMIVGALMLGQFRDDTGLIAGAILFGLAAGGLLPVWGAMVARSFGTARFGRALGAMNLAMTPITLLSAPYAGYLFDRYGSYQLAFLSYCAFLAAGLLPLALLRFPPLKTAGDASP